jgi:hypothetical protein
MQDKMKRNIHIKKIFVVCLVLILQLQQGFAQDLRFSQYFNSPLSINPANTGFLPSSD